MLIAWPGPGESRRRKQLGSARSNYCQGSRSKYRRPSDNRRSICTWQLLLFWGETLRNVPPWLHPSWGAQAVACFGNLEGWGGGEQLLQEYSKGARGGKVLLARCRNPNITHFHFPSLGLSSGWSRPVRKQIIKQGWLRILERTCLYSYSWQNFHSLCMPVS